MPAAPRLLTASVIVYDGTRWHTWVVCVRVKGFIVLFARTALFKSQARRVGFLTPKRYVGQSRGEPLLHRERPDLHRERNYQVNYAYQRIFYRPAYVAAGTESGGVMKSLLVTCYVCGSQPALSSQTVVCSSCVEYTAAGLRAGDMARERREEFRYYRGVGPKAARRFWDFDEELQKK